MGMPFSRASIVALFMPALVPQTLTLVQPLQEVVAYAYSIRHGRQRGVHRTDADEKASVYHIEIVQFMRFAVDVQDRCLGILTESAGPRLMRDACDGNVVFQICLSRYEVVGTHT